MYTFIGRVGNDRFIGSYATSRNSVVDYTIGSPYILSKCVNFYPLFSDIHRALQFSFKYNNNNTCTRSESNVDDTTIHKDKLGYNWNFTKKTDFIQNIITENIENIMNKLNLGDIDID